MGPAIRAVRQDKGLTLAQVSKTTGLAVSTLSKLEKGRIALTYSKLMLISHGLGLSPVSLLDRQAATTKPPSGAGRRIVQRAGEGEQINTKSYRHQPLAAELLHKKMTPMVVEVLTQSFDEFFTEFGEFMREPGEVFALVIEGELDFHSELYAPLRMNEGDSIYFDGAMGHAYVKASEGRCRLVASSCVCLSFERSRYGQAGR
ncbi:XRE family transcriptional regulator [Paucibacter sp. R3-3]|uniref:XRE family transcriptional regulator n=1 Tax=Roseateles agri TaxID=3098619 RepID=A0ABU5DPQ9_9BURK|nr:XRE family transcriptional regulator [Paucibacter sp. R3-3]MDY0747630.1 XRE family transcriptional regulator [Paucibacter sp. R3-3]